MMMCILTALALYLPAVTVVVGRRSLVRAIHVYAGIALPIPTLLGVAGRRWGAALRADFVRINRWSISDKRWLRTWGRDPTLVVGKFNAGQKANTAFQGGAIAVMLMTGIIMKWFGLFPLNWRTGATFVHDVLAFGIVVVVLGHIGYAIAYPDTLKAMIRGPVSRRWAEEHAAAWVSEVDEKSARG